MASYQTVHLLSESKKKKFSYVSNKNLESRDFPGGPVVKTLCSMAGGMGLIRGRGTKIPRATRPKKKKNLEGGHGICLLGLGSLITSLVCYTL